MESRFKQYDVVRVIKILSECRKDDYSLNQRQPQLGDVATILEIHSKPFGYELECSDEHGVTIWLGGYSPNQLELELVAQ